MKRIVALVILLALVFSGCGEEPPVQGSEPEAASAATVLGRVSRISGNDVALTLGTYGASASPSTRDSGTPQGRAPTQSTGLAEAAPTAEAAPMAEAEERTRGVEAQSHTRGSGAEAAAPGADGEPQGTGGSADIKFRESGEGWAGRIPVGTPIAYGTLNVDFSQLQPGYIVSLALGGADGKTVLSGEILSTS